METNYKKLIIDEFNSPRSKHCLTITFERIMKSVKLAKKIRMSGNKLYTECKHNDIMHQRIWDSYLCSIALSPNHSEMLATSYGNMSALMFHLSKYQECIDNIEEALKITESISLKVKLLCRKAKCLNAMGIPEKDKIFDEARSWLNKINDKDKMKVELIQLVDKAKVVLDKNKVKAQSTTSNEIHIDIFNENAIVNKKKYNRRRKNLKFQHLINLAIKETEGIFNSVDITYNDQYGSHLRASRDIQAGEIIFVIKPYIVVQNFTKSQNFCNNCLNVIWTGIPCKNCACCMFCSKKCQNEAMTKYHSIECPIIQFLVSGDSWLDYSIQASLRAIIMGVKEFGGIANLRDQINHINNTPDDEESHNSHHDSFISLFGFKNIHVKPEILSDLAAACCKTVICLSKFTSFFKSNCKLDTIENFIENEDTVFIAVLLLKIALIVFNNNIKVADYGLFCKNYVDSTKCSSIVPCCEKGISINTLSQFIPHSCDPNVKAMKTNNCKEIYYAVLPINEGDPILECYKNTFFECEFPQRHKEILQILNYNCTCLACQEEWPALLINDGKIMGIEYLMKIIIDSQRHNNKKQRLFNLVEKYGLAHQDIVDELSKALKINYNYYGQPSLKVCAIIYVLRHVFNELYGMKLNMPNTCKTGHI